MSRKPSLAELMGSAGAEGGISLSNLHNLLGHQTPELPRNAVGRYRLITALHQRFGPGYRSLPGISKLLAEFDDDVGHEERKHKLQRVQFEPPKAKEKK